jgi:5-methylcytosine-specific restriction endonuclease McrA
MRLSTLNGDRGVCCLGAAAPSSYREGPSSMPIVSARWTEDSDARQAARAAGEPFYFTGLPCKHGHIANRRVSNKHCVACSAERDRRHPRSPEKLRDRYRRRAARIRELYPEKLAERRRRWVAANPDKVRASQKASFARWYAANRDYDRERHAEWRRKNPEKASVKGQRQRARQRNAEGHFSAEDVSRITAAQGGKCACCRMRRKLTLDHIIPLAKGGSNWPANLQMLCKSCNSAKGARDQIEFMQAKGRLL